jgi:hypothetical protein
LSDKIHVLHLHPALACLSGKDTITIFTFAAGSEGGRVKEDDKVLYSKTSRGKFSGFSLPKKQGSNAALFEFWTFFFTNVTI